MNQSKLEHALDMAQGRGLTKNNPAEWSALYDITEDTRARHFFTSSNEAGRKAVAASVAERRAVAAYQRGALDERLRLTSAIAVAAEDEEEEEVVDDNHNNDIKDTYTYFLNIFNVLLRPMYFLNNINCSPHQIKPSRSLSACRARWLHHVRWLATCSPRRHSALRAGRRHRPLMFATMAVQVVHRAVLRDGSVPC